MAAVLLLQKEAQTFFWEISARGILLWAFFFFYFYRHRQRLPATAVVLSIICKRKCLPSNYHQHTIQPEICNLSLVWIRNFIEHVIKQKTTSEEYRRFHPTCRTSWERKNISLWHLQALHQFPVINCCWFPTTACDFCRFITRAWTLQFRHLNQFSSFQSCWNIFLWHVGFKYTLLSPSSGFI